MLIHSQMRCPSRRSDGGYVMLLLLLTVALMIIAAAAIVPSITFEIKRDREEEMIHRGVQYSRAIRAYYKKFGRYPTKLEDLENTNNLRFLRKRYKDPITGKDFKLLHFGEVQLAMSGIGGIPGANPIGAAGGLNGATSNSGGFSQTSTLGGSSAFGGNAALGGNSGFGGNSVFGSNSNSTFGQNQQTTNQTAGSDSTQPGSQAAGNGTGANPSEPGNGNSGDQLAGTTFGGGPIVGVASTSKDSTIREFDKKKKYNQWQFIYDPATDRGGIITTPNQPQLGFAAQPNLNGQHGTNGSNNGVGTSNGFGTGSAFGTSPSGMQNNPNSPSGGFGTPSPPGSPTQQQ